MSHLMKYTEWQSGSGKYCSGDVSDLAHNSNSWWYPARALGISVEDYVKMLINDFHAHNFYYSIDANVLFWDWTKEDCHKFTLFINNVCRKKNFFI